MKVSITTMLGSFMLLLIYFIAGLNKIPNITNVSKGLQTKIKFPIILCKICILFVIILEIFAPLIIMYSLLYGNYNKISYIATMFLVIFTIVATLMYHFPTQPNQYYFFIKNISIIGGLILLSNYFVY